MAAIISMRNYRKSSEQPVLVLVGLHQVQQCAFDPFSEVLANCKTALQSARSLRSPIAFVRRVNPPASVSEPQSYPAWIKGFEPTRQDMVFDVSQPSCYSNPEFSRTMDYTNGNFVVAGMFADTVCLSTAVDAYHRHHLFTYISDASLPQNNGAIPIDQFHRAVSQMISSYGTVTKTEDWTLALSPYRKVQ